MNDVLERVLKVRIKKN